MFCALARSEGRIALGLNTGTLPFDGVDLWTGYELSWLDNQGKPVIACARFAFPCRSPGMIESKSFKLYLNSFNQTRFHSIETVQATIQNDLSRAVQDDVSVTVYPASSFARPQDFIGTLPGECIDDVPVEIHEYQVNASLLRIDTRGGIVQEVLHSHLMKTNCPVTGQPDWASLLIRYEGSKIDRSSLLQYICSYRLQQEFHEQCVERMFRDLCERCACTRLTIEARFQRRGGLDINPFRSNCGDQPVGLRVLRQ